MATQSTFWKNIFYSASPSFDNILNELGYDSRSRFWYSTLTQLITWAWASILALSLANYIWAIAFLNPATTGFWMAAAFITAVGTLFAPLLGWVRNKTFLPFYKWVHGLILSGFDRPDSEIKDEKRNLIDKRTLIEQFIDVFKMITGKGELSEEDEVRTAKFTARWAAAIIGAVTFTCMLMVTGTSPLGIIGAVFCGIVCSAYTNDSSLANSLVGLRQRDSKYQPAEGQGLGKINLALGHIFNILTGISIAATYFILVYNKVSPFFLGSPVLLVSVLAPLALSALAVGIGYYYLGVKLWKEKGSAVKGLSPTSAETGPWEKTAAYTGIVFATLGAVIGLNLLNAYEMTEKILPYFGISLTNASGLLDFAQLLNPTVLGFGLTFATVFGVGLSVVYFVSTVRLFRQFGKQLDLKTSDESISMKPEDLFNKDCESTLVEAKRVEVEALVKRVIDNVYLPHSSLGPTQDEYLAGKNPIIAAIIKNERNIPIPLAVIANGIANGVLNSLIFLSLFGTTPVGWALFGTFFTFGLMQSCTVNWFNRSRGINTREEARETLTDLLRQAEYLKLLKGMTNDLGEKAEYEKEYNENMRQAETIKLSNDQNPANMLRFFMLRVISFTIATVVTGVEVIYNVVARTPDVQRPGSSSPPPQGMELHDNIASPLKGEAFRPRRSGEPAVGESMNADQKQHGSDEGRDVADFLGRHRSSTSPPSSPLRVGSFESQGTAAARGGLEVSQEPLRRRALSVGSKA